MRKVQEITAAEKFFFLQVSSRNAKLIFASLQIAKSILNLFNIKRKENLKQKEPNECKSPQIYQQIPKSDCEFSAFISLKTKKKENCF